uniref:nucleolar protein 58 n=1 Tax=Fragaria vesca subsp. vesca TaxID=101020 RepID=UPI0005CAEA24|nr:PREDICTED: nucleolar protein 58 [Fragaria vesca subsp. vesca]
MKTVQSHVLSSDPISLSNATSFLSAFNKSVCGGFGAASLAASHETCWFVRRALASFEELEQLHHKLKGPKSNRNRRSESQNDDVETAVGDNPAQSFVSSRDVSSMPTSHRHDDVIDRKVAVGEESKGGSRNLKDGGEIAEIDDKKKKEKEVKGAIGNIGENGGRIEEGDGESKMRNGEVKREKKKKKKKKGDNVDESGGGIKEEEDGEGKMGSEEAKKEEKKERKSEVLENDEVDALEEQQEKRKKRRKS